MDIHAILHALLGGRCDELMKDWPQIGRLDSTDTLKQKTVDAQKAEAIGELRVLQAKADALVAKVKSDNAEWWEGLIRKHGLPRGRNYTVFEDGTIHVQPKDKPDA